MKKITTSLLLATMLSINSFSQFKGDQTAIIMYGSTDGISWPYTITGVLTLYGAQYCDCVNYLEDAKSLCGPLAIERDDNYLAIEKRDTIPANDVDTTFLCFADKFGYVKDNPIYFKFLISTNLWRLDGTGHELAADLADYYLGTYLPIALSPSGFDTTYYYFNNIGYPVGYCDTARFAIIYHDPLVPLTPLVPYGSIITPVTFVRINADRHDNDIYVSWGVENEVKIKDYEVQRSVDGKNFQTVSVICANNSKEYQFTDLMAIQNNLYYRIGSVDISGKVEYSSIAKVGAESTNYGISAFPNPVSDITNIKFDTKGNYLVQLYNVNGQQIFNTKVVIPTGGGIFCVDMSKYDNGFYYLKITNGSVQNSLKLIKR